MNATEVMEQLLQILSGVEKRYEENAEGIRRAEATTWDLLHEIELGTHNGGQQQRLYKRLKTNLQERRAMKNENEALAPLNKVLQNTAAENLRLDLYKVKGQIKEILQTQETRIYTPRVCQDLTIGGTQHCRCRRRLNAGY